MELASEEGQSRGDSRPGLMADVGVFCKDVTVL